MKIIKKLIPLFLIGILWAGCDIIDSPYIIVSDEEAISADFPVLNESSLYRKVLFEEYTGHRCQNCPNGHRKIQELHNIFGDTLVPICIHATTLAAPTDEFPTDFRTSVGNDLATDFQIDGIPAGIVNRIPEPGGWGINRWQSKIQAVDRQTPLAAIQLVNQYNYQMLGKLKVNVKVTMLSENPNPLYLALYVVEDSIISKQIDGTEEIENYVHNHVLRGSLNGTYGIMLNNGEALQNHQACTYAKSIDFMGHHWAAENCSIVAILYDKVSKEVIQVETAPVITPTL